MSAGVATCPGDAKDENALFVAADRALYQAKASGKNQVYLFGESTRSYSRRRIAWRGYVEPVGLAGFPIETIEIGEGGFSFRSDRDVSTDTLLEASLTAPDGRTLAAAYERPGNVVKTWSTTTWQESATVHQMAERIDYHDLLFTPDSRRLLIGRIPATIEMVDLGTAQVVRQYVGHSRVNNGVGRGPNLSKYNGSGA